MEKLETESLWSKLEKYGELDIYPMHMPGHKRNNQMFPEKSPYEIDITEIEGFDDLQETKGILQEAKERAARLYGADDSYLLVNGSTVGILAGISAEIREGERILMARNCHKSVYNAVFLKKANPVYLYPEYMEEYTMCGSITVESVREKLLEYPDIKMVVLVSPTYEGIVSDIAAIAEVLHKKGIPLLVDEAHGAHFGFHKAFPRSAVTAGADLVVQSVHKTLPGFTQSALLHLNGTRIDRDRLEQYLNRYQSSSPSYILMGGIDRSMLLLEKNAEKLMAAYWEKLDRFYEEGKTLKNLHLLHLTGEEMEAHHIYDRDCSKLIIITKDTNQTGSELCDILLKDYKIQMEMASMDYALGMTSICDTWEGFARLLRALKEIDADCSNSMDKKKPDNKNEIEKPVQICMPWETENMEGSYAKIEECEGKISLDSLYLYPPGSPFLVPGEIISRACIEKIDRNQRAGLTVHGLDEKNRMKIAKGRKQMHFIYVIMGKSASGKDTLFHSLSKENELNLKTIVPYTTRPIREGEAEGVEYCFVSDERRKELLLQGKVIEYRAYNTIHGTWYYFTVDDGQFDLKHLDYLLIGTLEAYIGIQNYFGKEKVRPIYLEVEDGTRLKRAIKREMWQNEPKYAELCRRFLADAEDFSEEKLKEASVEKRYNNQDSSICLQQIIDDVRKEIGSMAEQ